MKVMERLELVMSPSSPIGVLTCPTRTRADHGKFVVADPEFIEPDRAVLVVFKGEIPAVLEGFPEMCLPSQGESGASYRRLLEGRCRPGNTLIYGLLYGSGRHAGRLVPPHVVPLSPSAQVHGEVLVGRLEHHAGAVPELGLDAHVAADLGTRRRCRHAGTRVRPPCRPTEHNATGVALTPCCMPDIWA